VELNLYSSEGRFLWDLEYGLEKRGYTMMFTLFRLQMKLQTLLFSQEGQDLVEYALVVALIAFGATAGMKSLATGLNVAFGNISTKLGSYVS
jgi:pilus assembly protein Flp/PilA